MPLPEGYIMDKIDDMLFDWDTHSIDIHVEDIYRVKVGNTTVGDILRAYEKTCE